MMGNTVRNLTFVLLCLWTVILMLLGCAPSPSEPSENDTAAIVLSLEVAGRDTATYRGIPIQALISCDRPLCIRDLGWSMGEAQFYRDPYIDYGYDSLREFSVLLYWTRLPGRKDSLKRPFDSIYIFTGGGIRQSNSVRVYVVNIAPEIALLTVNNSPVDFRPDIIEVSVDSAGPIAINAVIRDADDLNDVTINWGSRLYPQRLSAISGTSVTYSVPDGIFSDTIILHVYDRDGGEIWKKLYIYNTGRYTQPTIELIKLSGWSYVVRGDTLAVEVDAADTIVLVAVARDHEKSDSISSAWTMLSATDSYRLKALGCSAVYVIEKEKLYRNESTYRDTILVRVVDRHGLTDVLCIVITIRNRYPIIDSIRISGEIDTLLWGSDLVRRVLVQPGTSITLYGYAHDPDAAFGDYLSYSWLIGSEVVSDRILRYTCPTSSGVSRLSFFVTDRKKAAATCMIELFIEGRNP